MNDNLSIVTGSSNLKPGTNPPFTLEDFYSIYPQFGKDTEGKQAIPEFMIESYIELANNCIKQIRWHKSWKIGMSLYIAHFCTLYAQSICDVNQGVNGISESGKTKGLDTSISVGGVSVSTDYSATNNVSGYTGWQLTSYGQQLIQLARLYGKGNMMVR